MCYNLCYAIVCIRIAFHRYLSQITDYPVIVWEIDEVEWDEEELDVLEDELE